MDNLKDKAIRALSWDFFGKLFKYLVSFIISIFLARLLEPKDFGLIAMIMVFVTVGQVFSDSGLGGALVQRRRVLSIHLSSVFIFNILSACILSLIIFFSAFRIGAFYNNLELVPIVRAMSIIIVLNAFSSVQNVLLKRELNFKLMTQANLTSSFSSGVIGVLLAFLGFGVWSLVAQVLLQSFLYNIFIWRVTSWIPKFEFSFKALSQLWKIGFPVFITVLLKAITNRLDVIIIGKLFTFSALGYYDRAKVLKGLFIEFPANSLMAVLFPVLSSIQNDRGRVKHILKKISTLIAFNTFMLIGVIYFNAEIIIYILFGSKWMESVGYLEILILSSFVAPLGTIFVNILISRGKSKVFLYLDIYKKIVIYLNFIVLYIYGVDSFLYGLIVVAIINTLFNIYAVSKDLEISFRKLFNPILLQAVVFILSILIVIITTIDLDLNLFFTTLLKTILFLFLYLGFSNFFQAVGYLYTKQAILEKFKKKESYV